MEDLFTGGGWLEDMLREAARPHTSKRDILHAIEEIVAVEGDAWGKEWSYIDELIEQGDTGAAYAGAMASMTRTIGALEGKIGQDAGLEKPVYPFLVRGAEIKKLIDGGVEGEGDMLARPRDDLERLIGLERINSARRLLASWGTGILGGGSRELISKIEDDLEELGECRAFFLGDGDESLAGSERELELADRLATLATRFAQELYDLYMKNTAKPEVQNRFMLLWDSVRRLEEGGNEKTAAFEALQVLEEALVMVGLQSGELLQRVDLIYERFGDAEELRRVVNHLVNAYQDNEEAPDALQAGAYIGVIEEALRDLGLKVS
ncbi:MAG: hypothetical protein SWK76_01690 [Actinomycetota bacterium]|nr:hypothetical protein [Actinomycetota bacterium]